MLLISEDADSFLRALPDRTFNIFYSDTELKYNLSKMGIPADHDRIERYRRLFLLCRLEAGERRANKCYPDWYKK